MANVTLYIAISIDGFIADNKGGVGWLDSIESEGEDYGYKEFYDRIDTIVMGRKTHDFCEQFDNWPYTGKKSFVFSNTLESSRHDEVTILRGDVQTNFKEITDVGENIWLVGGGILNSEFLKNNLIDTIVLSIIPVVLGAGIPLFPGAGLTLLRTESTEQYKSGLVQIIYEFPKG